MKKKNYFCSFVSDYFLFNQNMIFRDSFPQWFIQHLEAINLF